MPTQPIRSLAAPPATVTWAQRLAAAVIQQTIIEAHHHEARAVAWLRADSEGLRFWCDVAGLTPTAVLAHVAPTIREGLPTSGTWLHAWTRG